MAQDGWEEAMEVVIGFLDAPPAPDSPEGRRFDEALRYVLSAAPTPHPEAAEAPAGLDASLRARLDDLARRRAGTNPFGDHPDGIGRTLGMDLGKA